MSPYLVAAVCMGTVMVVMAILVAIMFALRAVSARIAAVPEPVLAEGELPPELLAVLAAAVHTALGKQAVIHRVHVRSAGQENWSRVGRIDILRSHRMEPKRQR
jgi:Na+-transporting methylmalonyl-CoA/oxaloacetate decarboxylase gamma subunit